MQGIHESWVWWLTLFCVDITSCFYSIMLFVYFPLFVLLSISLFTKSSDVVCYILHLSLFMIPSSPSALIVFHINPSFKARALISVNAADLTLQASCDRSSLQKCHSCSNPAVHLSWCGFQNVQVYVIKWCIRHHWASESLCVEQYHPADHKQQLSNSYFKKHTYFALFTRKQRYSSLTTDFAYPFISYERDALRQELKIWGICQPSFFGRSCTIQLKLVEDAVKAWWVWHFTRRIITLNSSFEWLPSVWLSGMVQLIACSSQSVWVPDDQRWLWFIPFWQFVIPNNSWEMFNQ